MRWAAVALVGAALLAGGIFITLRGIFITLQAYQAFPSNPQQVAVTTLTDGAAAELVVAPSPLSVSPYPFLGLGAGAMLILLAAGVIYAARSPPSREVGGAVLITIAAVMLLSALYVAYIAPPIMGRAYDEVVFTVYSVEPGGSVSTPFKAGEAKRYEVRVFAASGGVRGPIEPEQRPRLGIVIEDPGGERVVSQVFTLSFSWVIDTSTTPPGVYAIETRNLGNESASLRLSVVDISMREERPLLPLAQWLSLVSAPVLGLGAWFILSHRRAARPLHPTE